MSRRKVFFPLFFTSAFSSIRYFDAFRLAYHLLLRENFSDIHRARSIFSKPNLRKSLLKGSKFSLLEYSSSSDTKCWNCQQHMKCKKFCCSLCGALQHPKNNISYFELFGVSETFDMNLEDLTTKFRDMQMTFHPDKFVNKSKTELEISEMYSRLLNKAYTTLKEPLKRGFYLLELKKLPQEENFPVDQKFLTSIMEKNEELESINCETVLNKFLKLNNEEINRQIKLISDSFKSNDWKKARINLMKLNYFLNLESRVKGKQEFHLNTPEQK